MTMTPSRTTEPRPSIYEEVAREIKCGKIAVRIMEALIYTIENNWTDDLWRDAAEGAKTPIPSELSRKRVIEILKSLRPVTLTGWEGK